MYKKLLVAYDGSALSYKALKIAKDYALQNDDLKVHIVSVIETSGPETNVYMTRSIMRELAGKLQPQIDKVAEYFSKEHIPVKAKLLGTEYKENPGKLICEYAQEHDVDLIIMGSRGLGNLRQVILGSVSNYVVQKSQCSVLIVKEQSS